MLKALTGGYEDFQNRGSVTGRGNLIEYPSGYTPGT